MNPWLIFSVGLILGALTLIILFCLLNIAAGRNWAERSLRPPSPVPGPRSAQEPPHASL